MSAYTRLSWLSTSASAKYPSTVSALELTCRHIASEIAKTNCRDSAINVDNLNGLFVIRPNMKTAKQLLEEFTASAFRDPKKTARLFCEDGAYEVPYLESLGLPWRYQGRKQVEQYFDRIRDLYPQLAFHDVEIVCTMDSCIVAEYEFTSRSSRTGRMIHQLLIGRLEATGGQIRLLRESVNLVEFALATYVNGLADYKVAHDRQ
jgi:hypothetical protein